MQGNGARPGAEVRAGLEGEKLLPHHDLALLQDIVGVGRAELIAAAHRKIREGSATSAHLEVLLAQVAADEAAGALRWLPITDAHLARVEVVFRHAPATVYLRAADTLHLASAAEAGFAEILSNDRHLLAAAPRFGLRGVDVIAA